jgi:hypothetical protein
LIPFKTTLYDRSLGKTSVSLTLPISSGSFQLTESVSVVTAVTAREVGGLLGAVRNLRLALLGGLLPYSVSYFTVAVYKLIASKQSIVSEQLNSISISSPEARSSKENDLSRTFVTS